MPDESCRKCGRELIKCSLCSKCRGAIQWICSSCGIKTGEEFHPHCLHLENYQILSSRNQKMIIPYSDTVKNNRKLLKKGQKNKIKFLLLALPIIVGCVTIIEFTNGGIFSKIINEASSLQLLNYQYYDNCLVQSNGASMTINCPTIYGTAYKFVTTVPKEFASQLEETIFSIRGISILEFHNTLILEYHNKMYVGEILSYSH